MKKVVSLLHDLKRKGLKVELDAAALNIKVRGNTALLSDEEKKALTSLKPEIIQFLNASQTKKVAHSSIPKLPAARDYTLSSAQQRLWVLSQFEASNAAYNMPTVLALAGSLDKELLELAFLQMIQRYEVLRTVFRLNDLGEVRQEIIAAPDFEFSVDFEDIRTEENCASLLNNKLRKAEVTPFDLAEGPLLRVSLFQAEDNRQVLFVNIHHIICDGISLEMLLEEAFARYDALSNGESLELPELEIQYKDYAHWQREQLKAADLTRHREYWLGQLGGKLPLLELPSEKVRPAVMTYNGSSVSGILSKATTSKLKELVQGRGCTLFMGLLAGLNALFYRYTADEDIIIGTPVSGRGHVELESQPGLFLNMLALRTRFDGTGSFVDLLEQVKSVVLNAYQYQLYPFDQLVNEVVLDRDASRSALFDVMLVMHTGKNLRSGTKVGAIPVSAYKMDQVYSKFDYTFNCSEEDGRINVALEYNTDIYSRKQAETTINHFVRLMDAAVINSAQPLYEIDYLGDKELRQLITVFNETALAHDGKTMVDHFGEQVRRSPDSTAVVYGKRSLTYRELDERSDDMAHRLVAADVHKGDLVGIYADRSLDMMVILLGILKCGAAYVPLDPSYPEERISYIIENAVIRLVVTQTKLSSRISEFNVTKIFVDEPAARVEGQKKVEICPDDLAYAIYTSGSTGKPKGVMVKHSNVSNFIAAMNKVITQKDKGSSWLAVTTISFDISVLELFWTLANGFKVVIAPTQGKQGAGMYKRVKKMDFSLFYFASEVDYKNKYKLLLEGARFGDANGFAAIWTPERHFHEFGGVYPNPAVTGAAIAAITKNIHIRSGSCVLPLHNPIRVAEEWAVVDNLSGGRVGLSFASGWVMNDFLAFAPGGFDTRQQALYKGIEQVRSLWEGNSIMLPNSKGADGKVEIYPKPLQKKIPIWVTSSDNPETFRTAGKIGANLLTHLLGQTIDELKEKIKLYRSVRREAGHEGEGHVTLMIHTYIDKDIDKVREKVEAPFKEYLHNATGLIRGLAKSMGQDINAETFNTADMDALLDYAFNRYFNMAALFGTPESCLDMVNRLSQAGVDELGCLVDFGLDIPTTIEGFQQLNALKGLHQEQLEREELASPVELMKTHGITHMQCTPSALKMMMTEEDAEAGFSSLNTLLVGGEPFPPYLLSQIKKLCGADVCNMYGPTETTVWSTTSELVAGDAVTVGKPIANTQVYVLDAHKRIVPAGVTGELYIGGQGVTAGYLHLPEMTADRFIDNPYSPGDVIYRTGDMGKWTWDGRIVLKGRKDEQVKVRGYRVEPGEIETALRLIPGISDAVVAARPDADGNTGLAAYIVTPEMLDISFVRNELSKKLPDHMMPLWFVYIDALPLTPNGKVDRLSLPGIDGAALATSKVYVPPANELESALVALWSEVLERQPEVIGVSDNFFELGGHSLNAVRLIGLIKARLGVKIDLQLLFYMPTIGELAREIEIMQWANQEAPVKNESNQRAKVRI